MHPTPDQLALFALGEHSPAVQEHLRTCSSCRAVVDGWARVVALGRSISTDDVLREPDERVWRSISQQLGAPRHSTVTVLPTVPGDRPPASERPSTQHPTGEAHADPPAVDPPAAEPPSAGPSSPAFGSRRSAKRRWPAVVLAAALALILGVGIGVGVSRVLADKTEVVGVTTLNALPWWKGSNGTATVEEDDAGNRTLVITAKIPATTPVDGTMQVWLSDSHAEDMVPMGVMNGPIGRFPVPKAMDLKSHPIVDVSLEPLHDTNPAHSENSMLRGRLAL